MLCQVIKITEHSLSPAYQDGDYVLVSRLPILLRGIHPGDVVIFQHPLHGKLIKQVDHLEAGGRKVFVTGAHPDSIDSRTFGAIPREMVLAKVIWHIPGK